MPFGPNPESDANPWSRIYQHAIKLCETLLGEDPFFERTLTIHRADFNQTALGLKENVQYHIDHCDFVVCVPHD